MSGPSAQDNERSILYLRLFSLEAVLRKRDIWLTDSVIGVKFTTVAESDFDIEAPC